MKNGPINKKIYKLAAGACRICGETNYTVLDTHRIVPGAENGKYSKSNTVCICCACHRKVHAGEITIDKYYKTTAGEKLRIIRNGQEDFI